MRYQNWFNISQGVIKFPKTLYFEENKPGVQPPSDHQTTMCESAGSLRRRRDHLGDAELLVTSGTECKFCHFDLSDCENLV